MPHAENEEMSSQPVNGEQQPSSAFLSHLSSLPVVHDSITGFKSNPIGQRSLQLADQGYATFAKPFLPYLWRPYQYVSPYVHKADSLANDGLSRVERTFPIVRTSTDEIKGTVAHTVYAPVRVASESKDYVFRTWDDQYKNTNGNGLFRAGRAMLSTGLVVTSDSLGWLGQFWSARKEEGKQAVHDKANQ